MEHYTSTFTIESRPGGKKSGGKGESIEIRHGKMENERFYQNWRPTEVITGKATRPAGTLVIAHGYAEHSGRYEHVGEFFSQRGISVWAMDHYGHGRSAGLKGDVPKFELLVEDLHQFITMIQEKEKKSEENQALPIVLLGHSMGGAAAALYAARYGSGDGFGDGSDDGSDDGSGVAALILSGPAVTVGESVSPFLKMASSIVAALAPAAPTVVFNSDTLSRNPEVVRRYKTDPLNYNGKVRARTGRELMRVEKLLTPATLSAITVPALIMHGGDDTIISPQCSRYIHQHISSENKELKIFDGLYHEILNEPEQEGVMKLMFNWMQETLNPSTYNNP